MEKEIQAQLSTATAEVASVSCPGDVEAEEGARFDCKAKLEGGGQAVVVVTQRERDEFTYSVKPGTMKLADESLESYLETQLKAKWRERKGGLSRPVAGQGRREGHLRCHHERGPSDDDHVHMGGRGRQRRRVVDRVRLAHGRPGMTT